MKKKVFLDLIDKSQLKYSEKYKKYYEWYYPLFENILYVFPDSTDINIPSLSANSVFGSMLNLNSYINSSTLEGANITEEEIKSKFDVLVGELHVWIDSRSVGIPILMKNEKKKKTLFRFFSVVMICAIIAAFVFTILECLRVFGENSNVSIWFGGLGLMTGIVFFLYERIDDSKKNKIGDDLSDSEISGFAEKYKTGININKSKFKATGGGSISIVNGNNSKGNNSINIEGSDLKAFGGEINIAGSVNTNSKNKRINEEKKHETAEKTDVILFIKALRADEKLSDKDIVNICMKTDDQLGESDACVKIVSEYNRNHYNSTITASLIKEACRQIMSDENKLQNARDKDE